MHSSCRSVDICSPTSHFSRFIFSLSSPSSELVDVLATLALLDSHGICLAKRSRFDRALRYFRTTLRFPHILAFR